MPKVAFHYSRALLQMPGCVTLQEYHTYGISNTFMKLGINNFMQSAISDVCHVCDGSYV